MARRLTLDEYEQSKELFQKNYQFYALMATLMRQADTRNTELLRSNWPDIWESLQRRYNAPLGVVEEWDGFTAEQYYGTLRAAVSEAEEEDWESG